MLALATITLVVCAPGYPGSAAEAKPAMDGLAAALSRAARLPPGSIAAVYEETEAGGLRRLQAKDAALLLAPLPFYLAQEQKLRLAARLSAVPQGGEALERWTLVTGQDHPPTLEGYTAVSTAGYEERFVRALAPQLPAGVPIEPAPAVLSALRKAASGEKIAVLLDGAQAASLSTLPFAGSLATIATSPPVPAAILATVGRKIDPARRRQLEKALLALADDKSARDALDGVRMTGFVALDERALGVARAAYRRAR